jgi:hypothetical protein
MQDTNSLIIEKIGTIVIPGHVPSINDYIKAISSNRYAGGKFEAEWVKVGNTAAKQWLGERWDYRFDPLKSGVHVAVKVYRLDQSRKRDVHNTHIKPILDGFVLAGVFVDDNETVMPRVTFEYCGVDKENPRVEFIIYQEMEITNG